MSDAPPKTAAGMIVDEALKVIPKEDRELAGQAAGAIVRDVFGSVAQVTTLLRYVVQFPSTAGRFLYRVARRIPKDKLQPPPAQLLLGAASGYAGTTDNELRSCFEKLLLAGVNSDTAAQVHPAFVGILKELSLLDARVMRSFTQGGFFASMEAFAASLLNTAAANDDVEIAMANLRRLDVVYFEDPYASVVRSWEAALKPEECGPGLVYIELGEAIVMTENNARVETTVKRGRRFHLTRIGAALLNVLYAET